MGQDWKTLGAVVIGAALAGWLVVRILTAGSTSPTGSIIGARATAPAPEPTAADAAVGEPEVTPAAVAAVASPAAAEPAPVAGGDESAVIERELTTLAQALQRDVRPEDRIMPRVNDVLDVPGTTEYRRAPDFWEPALSAAEGRTP
jgi:hypothetical protein